MDRSTAQAWLDAYIEAWKTYDPSQVEPLFADDATYRYHPWDEGGDVLHGRDEIVSSWVEPEGNASGRDAEGTYDARYDVYAVDGDRVVAVGWSKYFTDATQATLDRLYHNVFLMEFDDAGRCREFTEFFMLSGHHAEPHGSEPDVAG